MNWAWEQRLPPASKLVLMAIADVADDEGYCFPRVRTIAARCGVSERTVQRTLKTFESGDLLAVTPRFTVDGRQTSNGYRLSMANYPDKTSPHRVDGHREDDECVTGPLTRHCQGEGDTTMSPHEPPLEPSIESLLQPSASAQLFFPPGLLQGERAQVSRMISGIVPSDAQALLDELAYALERGTLIKKGPVPWFRGVLQSYRDGHFTATGGIRIQARRELQPADGATRQVTAANTAFSEPYRVQIREATSRWQLVKRARPDTPGRRKIPRTIDNEE
jgi:hypothetical protein